MESIRMQYIIFQCADAVCYDHRSECSIWTRDTRPHNKGKSQLTLRFTGYYFGDKIMSN